MVTPDTKGVPICIAPSANSDSTSSKASTSPGAPGSDMMVIWSSAATRYCLPPVLITANIVFPRVHCGSGGSADRLLCRLNLAKCPRSDRAGAKRKSAAGSRAGDKLGIGGGEAQCQWRGARQIPHPPALRLTGARRSPVREKPARLRPGGGPRGGGKSARTRPCRPLPKPGP